MFLRYFRTQYAKLFSLNVTGTDHHVIRKINLGVIMIKTNLVKRNHPLRLKFNEI